MIKCIFKIIIVSHFDRFCTQDNSGYLHYFEDITIIQTILNMRFRQLHGVERAICRLGIPLHKVVILDEGKQFK